MSFLVRNRVFFLVFAGLALAASGFWLQAKYVSKLDAQYCGIYEAYYAELEQDIPHVFRPVANPFISYQDQAEEPVLPLRFHRDSGEREMHKSEYLDETYERIIYDRIEFDTPAIFKDAAPSVKGRINNCFKGTNDKPDFSSLPLDWIEIMKFGPQPERDEDGFLRAFTAEFLTIHNLSAPLISADGQYALISTDSYCGSLCGFGAYYLFENNNGNWEMVGFDSRWVS